MTSKEKITQDVRIRVSPLQYRLILTKAQMKGYKTVAAFIRDSVLEEGDSIDKMIKHMYEVILEAEKRMKK